jgi:hypothetical protein
MSNELQQDHLLLPAEKGRRVRDNLSLRHLTKILDGQVVKVIRFRAVRLDARATHGRGHGHRQSGKTISCLTALQDEICSARHCRERHVKCVMKLFVAIKRSFRLVAFRIKLNTGRN